MSIALINLSEYGPTVTLCLCGIQNGTGRSLLADNMTALLNPFAKSIDPQLSAAYRGVGGIGVAVPL